MADFLYIHIPFCVRKCHYCDFLSVPFDNDLVKQYMDALCMELVMRKSSAGELRTVYLGGGTPSLLPEDSMRRLFTCLKAHYRMSSEAEVSMEANPGAISPGSLGLISSLGVNRLSLGVQSLVDSELRALGRIHTSTMVFEAADMIKASGLVNWSIDLMYGIPGQTRETWRKTLSAAMALSPYHISAYELTPEDGTPLQRLLQAGRLTMPSEEDILWMNGVAVSTLSAAGYRHYEISNFALPGWECRHNLNYWYRGQYIGAGAGAHSFVKGLRSSNTKEIPEYIRLLSTGNLPLEDQSIVSPSDAAREFIFLGLRKTRGIRVSDARAYDLDLTGCSLKLIDEGYLEIDGEYLRLTSKGMVVSNMVMVKLFDEAGL